jgi:hypothetical protein
LYFGKPPGGLEKSAGPARRRPGRGPGRPAGLENRRPPADDEDEGPGRKVVGGPTMTPQTDPGYDAYPGGEGAPAYRRVFDLWVLLFLGVICLGLLNFLGVYAKSF